jgi:hypothetical protein
VELYLQNKQKELLRKLVAYKKEGRLRQPFSLARNVNGLLTVPGLEDPAFGFEQVDFDALVDAGLLNSKLNRSGSESYSIHNLGYLAIEKNFDISQFTNANQIIGTYVEGNVSGGNLLSVGVANAQFSQIVNDPALLHAEIEAIITKMLEEVKAELKGRDLDEYIESADTLRQQLLAKDPPTPHMFKRVIRALSLLDNANGTLELTLKIWPLIQILITIAAALPK